MTQHSARFQFPLHPVQSIHPQTLIRGLQWQAVPSGMTEHLTPPPLPSPNTYRWGLSAHRGFQNAVARQHSGGDGAAEQAQGAAAGNPAAEGGKQPGRAHKGRGCPTEACKRYPSPHPPPTLSPSLSCSFLPLPVCVIDFSACDLSRGRSKNDAAGSVPDLLLRDIGERCTQRLILDRRGSSGGDSGLCQAVYDQRCDR